MTGEQKRLAKDAFAAWLEANASGDHRARDKARQSLFFLGVVVAPIEAMTGASQ